MIRAAIFAGIVWGIVWATDIYDTYISNRNERNNDDNHR
jgi:hypothetical protein